MNHLVRAITTAFAFVLLAVFSLQPLPAAAQANQLQLQFQNPGVLAPPSRVAPTEFARSVQGRPLLNIAPVQATELQSLRRGSLNFQCGGFGCVCTGDADCNDMFSTNVCGRAAVCIGLYCYCERAAR